MPDELAAKIRNGNIRVNSQEKLQKTFNLNIGEFALLEQLKTKWHFSDYSQTVLYCIWCASVSDGIESA